METGKTKSRQQAILWCSVIVLFVAAAALLLLARNPEPPRITASFVSFTNSFHSRFAILSVTNHSPLLVHFVAYGVNSERTAHQAETIPPGQNAALHVKLPNDFASRTHTAIELHFRRQDTAADEVREQIDSFVSSIGIRWPGLNPDSSANHFHITSSVPAVVLPR